MLMGGSEREVEIAVKTRWDSLAALRVFVGEDVEAAVVGDEVRERLLGYDERAALFEVIGQEGANASLCHSWRMRDRSRRP